MTQITRTWLIDEQQAQEIAHLADSLTISHSRLVRYLLNFALDEISAGRLVLRTRPTRYDLIDDK